MPPRPVDNAVRNKKASGDRLFSGAAANFFCSMDFQF
jgi:hypothetical protein